MNIRRALLCASMMVSSITPAAAQTASLGATAPASASAAASYTDQLPTATPIKHLVIIYGENVSFDHYFATYPKATNPAGEPAFHGSLHGQKIDNLVTANLLSNNPNFTNKKNGVGAANPFRLDRTQAATADQNHAYKPEQEAYDNGKMDLFPKYTGKASAGGAGAFGTKGQVMGYFDGNTVTALWNYAQGYAMSDNAWTDTYGPSTPGALAVVSGQTNGAVPVLGTSPNLNPDGQGGFTDDGDIDPAYDVCSSKKVTFKMEGQNIGDLLNQKKITWGGFMGGFDLGLTNPNGTTGCKRSSFATAVDAPTADYIPHHNWFQYYASTANYTHARPAALDDIGYSFAPSGAADPANHEYDLKDFEAAVSKGVYPAVSYLKLIAAQDAHAGYSDPLDEQEGVVKVINFLMRQPDWKNTAIIITYDDSDGWYDHAFVSPTTSSFSPMDALNGKGVCGAGTEPMGLAGKPVHGLCGPGTRIPFMVISPYAKKGFIAHTLINQASVVKFIEDNWLGGARLGGGSFDANAGSIMDMFDFKTAPKGSDVMLLDADTGTAAHAE